MRLRTYDIWIVVKEIENRITRSLRVGKVECWQSELLMHNSKKKYIVDAISCDKKTNE